MFPTPEITFLYAWDSWEKFDLAVFQDSDLGIKVLSFCHLQTR